VVGTVVVREPDQSNEPAADPPGQPVRLAVADPHFGARDALQEYAHAREHSRASDLAPCIDGP
jgi:hypothetical protein